MKILEALHLAKKEARQNGQTLYVVYNPGNMSPDYKNRYELRRSYEVVGGDKNIKFGICRHVHTGKIIVYREKTLNAAIPYDATLFFNGWKYVKPFEVIKWEFSTTFGKWGAFVRFEEGGEIQHTYPRPW